MRTWNPSRPSSSSLRERSARGHRADPADAGVRHRDGARHDGARRRRPLTGAAGADDRGRGRRSSTARTSSSRTARAPPPPSTSGCPSRPSTAWTSASVRTGLVFRLPRLARPPARPHRHRRELSPRSTGGAVVESGGTIRQAGYFFSLLPARLERAPGQRPGDPARRQSTRRCAPSAPRSSSSAASWIEKVGLLRRGCSMARTRRWTTACASSSRPAASASSSPRCGHPVLTSADGEPARGRPRPSSACASSTRT